MQYPASLCVPTTVPSRLAAVRRLVRPDALAVVASALASHTGTAGVADPVVGWLTGMFASGRLRYLPDHVLCNGLRNADLWRSPQATLAAGGGDCEDLAILSVSTLMVYGVSDAWLIVGSLGAEGHAWVEGSDAISGFLVEGTAPALVRGIRPDGYAPTHAYHPACGIRVFVRGGWQTLAT